ncbi:MAG: hypothetical protein O7G86_03650 [Gammaproteobacteria bacterium]|nr:hypothetical protein [Gammaproteobacteria bacterium]MCZ6852993.1 hypothetical protein [Gammaproteobacteria bacterium]
MASEYLTEMRPGDSLRHGTSFDVAFGIIVILASGFSAYTTYLGFSYDIPKFLAFALALIIGIGLLAINFKLRDAKRYATGLAGPLIAFLFVFVFSFVSNTNAIYTFFLQRDIIGQTQEEAWRVFDSETTNVLAQLGQAPALINLEQQKKRLAIARQNLKKQINDRNNPGLGSLAQSHLNEVSEILNTRLTPLRPPDPSAPMARHQGYADRLDDFIEEQAKTEFANSEGVAVIELVDKIHRLRNFYEDKIRSKEYRSDTTDLMKRDLDAITFKARDLLGKSLTLETINNSADETGSFQYTWTNFVNWISPAAIILSILLGALLDILAPVLSLTLYRSEEEY